MAAWPRTPIEQVAFRDAFCSAAPRVQAIELRWLAALSTTDLYRYRFDAAAFRPWSEASGQWIADEAIKPLDVERMPDLAQCHVSADIELRAVPSLWPIRDLACSGPWDFSVVRFTNARPSGPAHLTRLPLPGHLRTRKHAVGRGGVDSACETEQFLVGITVWREDHQDHVAFLIANEQRR